jgi:hypothetical protein
MRDPIGAGRIAGLLIFLFILVSIAFMARPAKAQEWGDVEDPFPPTCNENPCILTEDGGGYIEAYEQLAQRLRLTGWKLRIAGECYSACVILADKARPFVCITEGARFFIHQAFDWVMAPNDQNILEVRFPYPGFSEDVNAWIERNNGQPTTGWLYMPYDQALIFWPRCTEEILYGETSDD